MKSIKDFFHYDSGGGGNTNIIDTIGQVSASIPLGVPAGKQGKLVYEAAAMTAAISGIAKIGIEIKKWIAYKRDKSQSITVKFSEGSPEHKWLLRWLSRQPDNGAASSFKVKYLDEDDEQAGDSLWDAQTEHETKGHWAMIPQQTQSFLFDGMWIKLGSAGNKEVAKVSEEDMIRRIRDLDVEVTFTTTDRSKVLKFLDILADIGREKTTKRKIPGVYVNQSFYGWTRVRNVPTNRCPVLPEGVIDNLIKDLLWFVSAEEWYTSVGVPHRRGYQFYGVPGSGKTTLAITIAGIANMDIYLLAMDPKMTNAQFRDMVQRVPTDGILLLEDIDCIAATRSRDVSSETPQYLSAPETELTLHELLQTIDGAATPDGRLIITTTNHRSRIDRALIRPGRIDIEVEFHNATRVQIQELCRRFGVSAIEAHRLAAVWVLDKISMSEVQKRLLDKMGLSKEVSDLTDGTAGLPILQKAKWANYEKARAVSPQYIGNNRTTSCSVGGVSQVRAPV
jgi:mitochondrial chaperone BCS1